MDESTPRARLGAQIVLSLLLLPVLLILAAAAWLAFCEARKAYWDNRLEEMCRADGGVKIFDHIVISKSQFSSSPKAAGHMGVAPLELAKPEDVAFSVLTEKEIHHWNPRVIQWEQQIKRRTDEKVVASITTYSRIGGDFPSPAHESYFSCPDAKFIASEEEAIFIISEE